MRSTTSCTKKHRWSAPSSSFTLGGNRYACSGLYGRNRGISLSASFCLCFSSEFSRTHLKPRPFKSNSREAAPLSNQTQEKPRLCQIKLKRSRALSDRNQESNCLRGP